jgi:hypothetical protein
MAHRRRRSVSQRTAIRVVVTVGVAAIVSVAVLLVLPTSAPAAPAPSWAVRGPLEVVDLPVVRCPTSFGIPVARKVAIPTHERAVVSAPLAATVSVFTDGLETLEVVAPTSWACTALDGVGGASTLIVYPPGLPTPAWGDVTAVRSGIVVSQTGACTGCSLEVACPLFPAARRAYFATYGVACQGVASRREQRVEVSAHRVLFIDPPGILGAGRPSGGGLTAFGAVLWRLPGLHPSTAWLDTCTLPPDDQQLCVLSVRAFLARHPE